MDVSIIIVNYNASDLLNQCLCSLKKTTSCQHEIIVVDNNSSDNSIEMILSHHADVKLIPNTANMGFAKANNQAINVSGRPVYFHAQS